MERKNANKGKKDHICAYLKLTSSHSFTQAFETLADLRVRARIVNIIYLVRFELETVFTLSL